MARKRSSQPDEGQFSLDDFINQDPVDAESVPEMIDLSPQPEPVEAKTAESKPLRTFTMPSSETANEQPPTPPSSDIFHNLGKMYPNPPIPMDDSGMVLHRATLYDITGIDTLLDWVSDGDAALVEMERLMNREHEVKTVLARLHRFIEMDMGGQIVQITETRVMLLPPGCVGISGLEDEAFNDEAEWTGGV
ncbi:MAG: hypothetical protein QGG62_07275 [Candidatus Poseidoniaceae archaeon]|jgi:SepF-like predicted cell division protein (DUF552 family)|nr:hypothetical protein [Candidatus Poseidoniaceae archaeon]